MSNIKEQYRKAFLKHVNKYESSEVDYSELNEIFEELWSECGEEINY